MAKLEFDVKNGVLEGIIITSETDAENFLIQRAMEHFQARLGLSDREKLEREPYFKITDAGEEVQGYE